MKFTISWLKDHLETKSSDEDIINKLTAIDLEVEEVIDAKATTSSTSRSIAVSYRP